MSPSRTPDGILTEKGKERLITGIWRTGMGALALAGTTFAGLIWHNLPDWGHEFVNNSPAVVQAQATAVEAKDSIAVLATKLDTVVQALPQMLASLKQSHADTQALLVSGAATNQHLTDIDARVARVESHQDAGK